MNEILKFVGRNNAVIDVNRGIAWNASSGTRRGREGQGRDE
jgi:hypothetical protein